MRSRKVDPSAWDRTGYEDARRGLSCWPLNVAMDADAHDIECATAYLTGYDRGINEQTAKVRIMYRGRPWQWHVRHPLIGTGYRAYWFGPFKIIVND